VVAGERLARAAHGPAGIWYGWVGLPVFYFALLLVLLQWSLWASSLWRVSRVEVRTEAAHPDRAGGIGFLARPSLAFTVVLMASSAVLASAWGTDILIGKAKADDFVQPIAVWAVLALLVAVGPLLCFVPLLVRTQREGKHDLGRLATDCVRAFRARWIDSRSGGALLGSADIRSLAELDHTFSGIRQMRIIPIGPADVLRMIAGTLLPMVPFALAEVPMSKLLGDFARTLL
jgi:hypothetical protein